MDSHPHRSLQQLPKIGPVYSEKDEKQRIVAQEILDFKLRPEMRLKINMNIPGLDKKKTITNANPETMRLTGRLSSKGRAGWLYVNLMTNHFRFAPLALYIMFYYFQGYRLSNAKFYEQYDNNGEWEGIYPKMQTFPGHYVDVWSFMA
jgi:hypothetical protein